MAPEKILVAVCGANGAGKTSLIQRLLYNIFPTTSSGTKNIEYFSSAEKEVENTLTFTEIPDKFLLNQSYSPYLQKHLGDANVILMVMDGSKQITSELLDGYFKCFEKFQLLDRSLPIYLIVNKMDQASGIQTHLHMLFKEFFKEKQIAGLEPDHYVNFYFISSRNNSGIKKLRNLIGISHPLNHKSSQVAYLRRLPVSPVAIEPPRINLSAKFLGSAGAGVLAGGIASALGMLAAIHVGIGVAASIFGIATARSILMREFFIKNHELRSNLVSNLPEKKPPLPISSPQKEARLYSFSSPVKVKNQKDKKFSPKESTTLPSSSKSSRKAHP